MKPDLILTRRRGGAENADLTGTIVDAAYHIHRDLGPGLLESVYSVILDHTLRKQGLSVRREAPIPVIYDGLKFELGFRADLLVENTVCIELKSVEKLAPVHSKQLLTYLKLLNYRTGLLINFGSPLIKDGIVRLVNSHSFRASASPRENPVS